MSTRLSSTKQFHFLFGCQTGDGTDFLKQQQWYTDKAGICPLALRLRTPVVLWARVAMPSCGGWWFYLGRALSLNFGVVWPSAATLFNFFFRCFILPFGPLRRNPHSNT
jgi:hypothetical protein